MRITLRRLIVVVVLVLVLANILCIASYCKSRYFSKVDSSEVISLRNDRISKSIRDDRYNKLDQQQKLKDRELLSKIVFLEAGNQSYNCKKLVVSVIINRLNSRKWGNSIEEVIYFPYQFSSSSRLINTIPYRCDQRYYQESEEFIRNWDDCYRSVDEVMMYGSLLPSYVYYFRDSYPFDWKGYMNYKICDNMYFGYLLEDKNNE